MPWPRVLAGRGFQSALRASPCEQNEKCGSLGRPAPSTDLQATPLAYLEKLNPEQRRAVEHGARENERRWPAAHHRRRRVRQDGDAGASRRASDRQGRRSAPHHADDLLASGGGGDDAAGRAHCRAQAMPAQGRRRDRRAWPGPARSTPSARGILREYAEQIGLAPAFTIHDREDSADLMNLVRHELGFSQTEKRFPTKGTCLADLFARRQRANCRSRRCLGATLSLVRGVAGRAARSCSQHYVEAKQRQHVLDYDDLLLYWAHMMPEPAIAADDIGGGSITCWSTNIRTPTGCRPRSCWR